MSVVVNEPVSVSLVYKHPKRQSRVSTVVWNNKAYKITKHGLHHTYQKGDTSLHIFSVSSGTMSFRLLFNSKSLNWVLEQVYDENTR